MDLLHHLEKGKEELSPLQYHIKSLHIISRHYKKSLLRSQIYHGYEELSTDTNYPIWRRQERRSKYEVQLASWQLRSNTPKTSVHPPVCPKPEIPSFHLCMGPSVHPTNYDRFAACPSVRRGFQAFAGEHMEGMAWNLACWCILTTFSQMTIYGFSWWVS